MSRRWLRRLMISIPSKMLVQTTTFSHIVRMCCYNRIRISPSFADASKYTCPSRSFLLLHAVLFPTVFFLRTRVLISSITPRAGADLADLAVSRCPTSNLRGLGGPLRAENDTAWPLNVNRCIDIFRSVRRHIFISTPRGCSVSSSVTVLCILQTLLCIPEHCCAFR